MEMSRDMEELTRRRNEIRAELAEIGDMRPGTLVPRFRKCGKTNCHCAKDGSLGHGPSWALTWKVEGKTTAQIIPEGPAVEFTKEHIAEFRRFRELSRKLIELNEKLCNTKLKTFKADQEATAKRGH